MFASAGRQRQVSFIPSTGYPARFAYRRFLTLPLPILDLATLEGYKAEFTWVVVIWHDSLYPPKTVTSQKLPGSVMAGSRTASLESLVMRGIKKCLTIIYLSEKYRDTGRPTPYFFIDEKVGLFFFLCSMIQW